MIGHFIVQQNIRLKKFGVTKLDNPELSYNIHEIIGETDKRWLVRSDIWMSRDSKGRKYIEKANSEIAIIVPDRTKAERYVDFVQDVYKAACAKRDPDARFILAKMEGLQRELDALNNERGAELAAAIDIATEDAKHHV